jgi:hypothetical protein
LEGSTVLSAALLAADITESQEIAFCERTIAGLVEQWRDEFVANGAIPSRKMASSLLEFLHRRVLTGKYHRVGWDVCHALKTGEFNCLTASLLYYELATRAGLEATPVQLPAHVAVMVSCADTRLFVETTLANGVQFEAPPKGRALSPTEFVGLVYFNRAVESLESGDLAGAIRWNLAARRLAPHSPEVSGNLTASINRAAWLATQRGDFREALRLLAQGSEWLPQQQSLRRNRDRVASRWILAVLGAEMVMRPADRQQKAGTPAPFVAQPVQ